MEVSFLLCHINKPNTADLLKNRASLTRFAWLSIAAALATIALKTGAYLLTDSVGLLSDALESLVNLAGAIMALIMLTIAARPADESHVYGHSKAEYFASVTEGFLGPWRRSRDYQRGDQSAASARVRLSNWGLGWAFQSPHPPSISSSRVSCCVKEERDAPSHSKRMLII